MGWLVGERRSSAHTVAAYGRDLAFFLDFLAEHLGEQPCLATLSALAPSDYRAFLTHRAARLERSSVARSLSVVRGFIRFLERRGLASCPALAVLRAPKLPTRRPEAAIGSGRGGNHRGARRHSRRRMAGHGAILPC